MRKHVARDPRVRQISYSDRASVVAGPVLTLLEKAAPDIPVDGYSISEQADKCDFVLRSVTKLKVPIGDSDQLQAVISAWRGADSRVATELEVEELSPDPDPNPD